MKCKQCPGGSPGTGNKRGVCSVTGESTSRNTRCKTNAKKIMAAKKAAAAPGGGK